MNYLKAMVDLRGSIPRKTNPYIEAALNLVEDYFGWGDDKQRIIGAFGDVVFEVSSEKIETIRDFKRSAKGRYATHEIVGGKSVVEFLGSEPDEITFQMQLVEDFGVKIQTELRAMLEMLRSGEPNYLILGGQALGVYMWYLTGVDVKYEYTDRKGRPIVATLDVTMRECVR